ncbi:hypothetical protein [Acinetobacter ursingii]|uniref:hypothetical protein n=1 Tax=Acinetobacter ursingii TaxID=108980 RepID=UPI00124C238B|nr:hypothetical protein [Acinetobacter ursingii]MCU4351796.1 hypothetical protein [Acinetobacter ursingii]MCU4603167.1 hypothetical protein [Acinetobacter ursingii]MDI3239737.1 hypothetical protein [Acinetobacter ursingii]
MKNLFNYKPKNQIKVDGKMSEQGADRAGNRLADAAFWAAWLFGCAAIIFTIGLTYKNIVG